MKYLFFGIIFIAFGLGVKLSQITKITDGLWFLGIGFLLLIISVITKELKEHSWGEE